MGWGTLLNFFARFEQLLTHVLFRISNATHAATFAQTSRATRVRFLISRYYRAAQPHDDEVVVLRNLVPGTAGRCSNVASHFAIHFAVFGAPKPAARKVNLYMTKLTFASAWHANILNMHKLVKHSPLCSLIICAHVLYVEETKRIGQSGIDCCR